MHPVIKRFATDETGATAVEYSVMLALILLVILVGITATGSGTLGWWTNTSDEMTTHGM